MKKIRIKNNKKIELRGDLHKIMDAFSILKEKDIEFVISKVDFTYEELYDIFSSAPLIDRLSDKFLMKYSSIIPIELLLSNSTINDKILIDIVFYNYGDNLHDLDWCGISYSIVSSKLCRTEFIEHFKNLVDWMIISRYWDYDISFAEKYIDYIDIEYVEDRLGVKLNKKIIKNYFSYSDIFGIYEQNKNKQ